MYIDEWQPASDYFVLCQTEAGSFYLSQGGEIIAENKSYEEIMAIMKLINQPYINNTNISSQVLMEQHK